MSPDFSPITIILLVVGVPLMFGAADWHRESHHDIPGAKVGIALVVAAAYIHIIFDTAP